MNTAKKFILHTNFPGHYDFSIYYRCNFALPLGSSNSVVLTAQSKVSLFRVLIVSQLRFYIECCLCNFYAVFFRMLPLMWWCMFSLQWSEIESFLSCDERSLCEEKMESRKLQQPVVLNRCTSNNDSNPFGSTFCFGLQDVIFEVMANDHIATVMLLNS
ncbi:hypothetical protein D918_04119 [Trichuris suis]|nr:hypothetical protein D918_04119 [Trichuris suis]